MYLQLPLSIASAVHARCREHAALAFSQPSALSLELALKLALCIPLI